MQLVASERFPRFKLLENNRSRKLAISVNFEIVAATDF
jgi:hypothetical protein